MCQIYKKHELGAASITGMCQIYKKHELGAASITGMCHIQNKEISDINWQSTEKLVRNIKFHLRS